MIEPNRRRRRAPRSHPDGYRRHTRRHILAVLTATGVLAACGETRVVQTTPPAATRAPGTPAAGPSSTPVTTVRAGPSRSATALAVPTPSTAQPVSAPSTPAATPVPTPVDDGRRRLSGYGFQAHLWGQDRRLIVDRTLAAGFGWLKQQIEWQQIEPFERGGYDWRELDKIVAAVNAAGLKLLLTVVRAPDWALGDRAHGPPGDPLDFGDFMRVLAARYRGRVHAYELWNEANLSREWGYGRIDAGEFVELLQAGHAGVKASDPAAVTVGGALTPAGDVDIPDQQTQAVDDLRFLRQMYAYRDGLVRGAFDAWGVHPGGFNNAPDQAIGSPRGAGWNGHPSFYFLRFTQHREVMEEFGDAAKPMWFTEFGWSTENAHPGYGYGADNSEDDQARFLVDAFTLVRDRHPYVSHMFVWNLNFQMVVGPDDEKYPFGVLRPDASPRPAYVALQAMPKGVA